MIMISKSLCLLCLLESFFTQQHPKQIHQGKFLIFIEFVNEKELVFDQRPEEKMPKGQQKRKLGANPTATAESWVDIAVANVNKSPRIQTWSKTKLNPVNCKQ